MSKFWNSTEHFQKTTERSLPTTKRFQNTGFEIYIIQHNVYIHDLKFTEYYITFILNLKFTEYNITFIRDFKFTEYNITFILDLKYTEYST